MSSRSCSSWKTRLVAVLAFLALSASGQQAPTDAAVPPPPPVVSTGRVTLPYQEWKTLWEAAQPKPVLSTPPAKAPAPPVPFSVQSARYAVDFGGAARQATGQSVFEVTSFAEGWTAVPLLPVNEVRLSGIEPEASLVAVQDGAYTLLLDGPGRRVVTLRFSVDLPEGENPSARSLRLTGPAALVNDLRVTGVPIGFLAEVRNALPVSTAPAASAPGDSQEKPPAPLLFHLPADQPIALTLVSAEERKPAPPPAASVWQGEAQSLVRDDEGQLVYQTRLRLTTDAGAGLNAELALPTAANVLAVTGADLEHWRVVKAGPGEMRHLEVAWKTPDVLRREVLLDYALPQPQADGDWRLVSPQVGPGNDGLRSALYALPTIAGVEFVPGEEGGPLPPGDAQTLPRWLAQELANGNFVALNVAKPAPADNAVALVRVHRLPLIHTARATVDECHFHTRLVADGALLSEGTFVVRHDGALTVSFKLPEDAQLLACSVDGHEAPPVDRGGGRLDLTLPAGVGGKPTGITLSYTGHRPGLAPVSGKVSLSLPETDLFVQTLLWDLQIPEAYELTALEGNVSLSPFVTLKAGAPVTIHLGKELLKGEQPTAELYYQKRAVNP